MMSLVVVIGLVAACTASPSLYFSGPQYYSGYYPASVVSPIKSQYHSQNEQGQYAYGYNDGYSTKSETKHANGLTEGAYSYVDPNGVLQQYRYVSDENGYRVSGTNLPAAPVVPAVQAYAAPVAVAYNTAEVPQPVQDTPEVVAAKVAHQAAYEQAKKAADEAPANEAPVDYNTPVQDTPEVAAAKAAHQEAHEQAKQAVGYQSYAVAAAPAPAPVASYAYAVAPAPAYAHVAPAPVVAASSDAELPQPVQDTPEVAAAKAAHQAAFDQAKKAAEEAPSDEPAAPATDAVEVSAPAAVVKTAVPSVAYGYQTAYPSYAVAPVATSYAYNAPAYKYAAVAPVPVAASYGYAAAAPAYAYAPFAAGSYSPVHSQYHSQDEFGQYSYGYNSGSSSKAEVKTLDGVTRGGYSYVDSNGVVQHYNYVSDPVNGFRVAGTNLPSNTL